ncbi:hypothetical protein J41TS12_10410 [Paenibacillus antibioticophila]|uniref:LexA repressor DNA-binding domain-containing protein n=1 Tax=Paenibacillus antibioticophila TaxID=1274374 RepID=A0A919XSN9_9BACL|nr:hypothetical protein [Paenibacillus antibioticophila]GIO36180.1 hypothetical protein J41TS12_10410 [Paenibacillus antibioticophila]
MLNDLDRKLLRILSNYINTKGSAPTMEALMRKMGRQEPVILRGLSSLQSQGYIQWQPTWLDTIKIIEAWDRDAPAALKVKPKIKPSDTRYWTEY